MSHRRPQAALSLTKLRQSMPRTRSCYAASQMVLGPMYLGLIERLLALLPSVWLMLGAAHHDRLHADRYLVRACGAQKISHASLGYRREEDEDGEQGEEKVAREPCASHHRIVT